MTNGAEHDDREPNLQMGLCLSGGGYRAMLYHVGSLLRLYETGLLDSMQRISSVSGGSITSAWLALQWSSLMAVSATDSARRRETFRSLVASPIQRLASVCIDVSSTLAHFNPFADAPSAKVAEVYDRELFQGKSLADLPEAPTFIINATNLTSGALWRFRRDYMGDWRVGRILKPQIPLATAVAASSAFPPFLSPYWMLVSPADFAPSDPGRPDVLTEPEYRTSICLSDGGVYDNLGLEPVSKRCRTLIVSDGGGPFDFIQNVSSEWVSHLTRVLCVVDNQVRSLRKRGLMEQFEIGRTQDRSSELWKRKGRLGCYAGIATKPSELLIASPLNLHDEAPIGPVLALEPTRLKAMSASRQHELISWGYANMDHALRNWYQDSGPKPMLPWP